MEHAPKKPYKIIFKKIYFVYMLQSANLFFHPKILDFGLKEIFEFLQKTSSLHELYFFLSTMLT